MAKKKQTFEESLAELEALAQSLEGEGVSLQEALSLYEKGQGLITQLSAQIQSTQARITLLGLDGNETPMEVQDAST